MKCSQCRKQLIDYISGRGDKNWLGDIKIHLKECARCNQEAKRLKKVWNKLGNLPEQEPSPRLRTQFYAMLNKMQETEEQNRLPLRKRIKNIRIPGITFRPVPQFGFALLFLAVGLILGHYITSQRIEHYEISQMRQEISSMQQMISLTLLQENEPVERLKGITYINQMHNPEKTVLSALVQTLNSDPNVNVRLAAVDALSRFLHYNHLEEKIEQSLRQQSSPLVQISLIDLMAEKETRTTPEVIDYLLQNKNINPVVKEYARKKFNNQI
ncbi:MAG: HEAT repeat domain-containing protein [bacterium]